MQIVIHIDKVMEETNCIWMKENKCKKTTKEEEDVFLSESEKSGSRNYTIHLLVSPIHPVKYIYILPLSSILIHPSVNINKKWIATETAKEDQESKILFLKHVVRHNNYIYYICLF